MRRTLQMTARLRKAHFLNWNRTNHTLQAVKWYRLKKLKLVFQLSTKLNQNIRKRLLLRNMVKGNPPVWGFNVSMQLTPIKRKSFVQTSQKFNNQKQGHTENELFTL